MHIAEAVIAHAALVPLLQAPTVRAEQVNQLVMGETALVLEAAGDWQRLLTDFDHYEGWAHAGYLHPVTRREAADWRNRAQGWSDGAVVQDGGALWRLPVRARVDLVGDRVTLPGGRKGRLTAGRVRPWAQAIRSAQGVPPSQWAVLTFAGTPYQWGGVTPWGVDCSGLVQTTFAARGLAIPRDAARQASVGTPVAPEGIRPNDVLCFCESGGPVTHVALAGEEDTLVHAALSCGGVVTEPWAPGTRAGYLRERLVAVRRLEDPR